MNHRFAPFFAGILSLVAAAPAYAQVPFNSTSPPNPFNRFPTNTASNQPASAGAQGQYPNMAPTPGYTQQATSLNATGVIDPNHRLTRQDRLSYQVAEDRDGKVWPLIVDDSGNVQVPLLGFVKAAGRTTSELSSEIKSRLDSEYYWHATVSLGLDQVAAHSAGRVFIMGELTGKGALDLPADGHLTVSQAILQMGGPTDDSNLKHVRVMRPSANAKGYIEVNVAAVLKGDASKDLVLQPGDTVNVPKNLFGIKF